MKKWHPIGISLLVLALPGVAAFVLVKALIRPPAHYVIQPPEQRIAAQEPAIVHGTPTREAGRPQQRPADRAAQPGPTPERRTDGTAPRPTDPSTRRQPRGTGNNTAPRPNGATAPTGQPRERGQFMNRGGAFGLMRVFRGIGRLDENGTTPLTPAQAKAILAIMTPLRTQPTLTPEKADSITKQLNAQLTAAQRDAIAQMRGRRPGPGGQGGERRPEGMSPRPEGTGAERPEGAFRRGEGDGERRPEGAPARGEGRPGGMEAGRTPPPEMVNFNPFYTNSENPMAQRMAERWQAVFEALEAKAAKG